MPAPIDIPIPQWLTEKLETFSAFHFVSWVAALPPDLYSPSSNFTENVQCVFEQVQLEEMPLFPLLLLKAMIVALENREWEEYERENVAVSLALAREHLEAHEANSTR